MSNENKEVKTEVKTEVETLKEQMKALQFALNKARAIVKQKFRIESTQTANNFHISFNQLFSTEQMKTDYKDLIIENLTNKREVVFKIELKEKLKDRIIKALQKE